MERTNMNATVLNLENEKKGDLEIPIIFQTPIRPDLIKKAVLFQHFE